MESNKLGNMPLNLPLLATRSCKLGNVSLASCGKLANMPLVIALHRKQQAAMGKPSACSQCSIEASGLACLPKFIPHGVATHQCLAYMYGSVKRIVGARSTMPMGLEVVASCFTSVLMSSRIPFANF